MLSKKDRDAASAYSRSWSTTSVIFLVILTVCVTSFLLVAVLVPSPGASKSSADHAQLHEQYSRQNYLLRQKVEELEKELNGNGKRIQRLKDGSSEESQLSVANSCNRSSDSRSCPACPAVQRSSALLSTGDSNGQCRLGMDGAFAAYVRLHNDILSGKAQDRKFVVARPQAQMNNRLRVIITAILFGMLTGRATLVDFSSGYYAQLHDMFSMPIDVDLAHFDRAKLPSGSEALTMNDIETILCSDYKEKFHAPVVHIDSPPSLIPFYFRNPHHKKQLQQWFGSSEEYIYRHAAEFFLKPSAPVQAMLDEWMDNHWKDDSTLRVGVHLRWGGDHRPQPVPENEWNDMVHCVDAILPPSHGGKVVIYVAADTAESRSKSHLLLTSFNFQDTHPHLTSQIDVVHFGDEWLRSNNVKGVQAALTELLLLSKCDILVLTPRSSYGEQAMSLSGHFGYFVKSNVQGKVPIAYNLKYMHEVVPNCLRTHTSVPSIEGFQEMIEKASCYQPDMFTIHF